MGRIWLLSLWNVVPLCFSLKPISFPIPSCPWGLGLDCVSKFFFCLFHKECWGVSPLGLVRVVGFGFFHGFEYIWCFMCVSLFSSCVFSWAQGLFPYKSVQCQVILRGNLVGKFCVFLFALPWVNAALGLPGSSHCHNCPPGEVYWCVDEVWVRYGLVLSAACPILVVWAQGLRLLRFFRTSSRRYGDGQLRQAE